MNDSIVIIGSGFASYQLVKAIRRQDKNIEITVVTADDGHDYNKPDLSHVFSKKQSVDDVITISAEDFSEQNNIRLLTNTKVSEIDTHKQPVSAGEHNLPYTKLVFATGATPFIPPIKGSGAKSLLTLNNLDDFVNCQQQVEKAESVLVIGGRLIGVELALDLSNAGKKVTLMEPASQLMANQLPEYVSHKLKQHLEMQAINIITGCSLNSLEKHENKLHAFIENNSNVIVDEVLVCAGLRSNIALAQQSNIEASRGICVDDYMQTSVKNIYALGDCAELNGQVRAYLQPTLISANALAKTLVGEKTKVALPNMMVKVKTPSYPIQIGGITSGDSISRWTLDVQSHGIIAKAYGKQENMVGFVVTNQQATQAFPLLRELQ